MRDKVKKLIPTKGKDLKSGDVVIQKRGKHDSVNIIVSVDINGIDKFWSGRPNYSFYYINDCNYGPYHANLKLSEIFYLITDRKEILRYYDMVELELLRNSAEIMRNRNYLIDIKRAVLEY